ALLLELVVAGVADAADRVPRCRLEQNRLLRAQSHLLEGRNDRPGAHRLAGEQVGGPHLDAEARAALDQRLRDRRRHQAAGGVVDAAGEVDVQVAELIGRETRREEDAHHALPENEAAARADVAAALRALEDEAARTLLQERIE